MADLHKSKPNSDDRRLRRSCCKRHPKHRQSPGVCSLCLAEKLSQIIQYSTAAARKISYSLSSSSDSSAYYSSAASCSSCSSPNPFNHHPRDSEDRDRRKANLMFSMFKKSRSMAIIEPRSMSESGDQKSRFRFWSRFLSRRPRRKRNNELMHSSTVVQRNVHG